MANLFSKIDEIIVAFGKWFENDPHSRIEDFYKNSITYEALSQLSQNEFEVFFLEFVKQGGKIQSGGARTANQFIQTVHQNFSEFRKRVLDPFNSDFDVFEWLKWSENFKFFGKGLATIYLNRVDKSKFVIVNNKSIDAYKKLGYKVSTTPLERIYKDLLTAQTDLIKKHPELNNFFRADALSHFLVGTPDGKIFLEKDKINYWIFQANPKHYDIINSLKDNALKTWSVSAHKNEILTGDKVILWVTGDKQGCYALCEVTSHVYEALDDKSEMEYYTFRRENEIASRVRIKITNNLVSNPITKDQISSFEELSALKVGLQGTNFTATEVEYKTLLRLAENQKKKYAITRESILKSIELIDNDPNLRRGRESIEYDLVYNKRRYPPILVLSEANKLVGGEELLLSDFGNSTKNAFSILQSNGFVIERKTMDFSEQLVKFLAQSKSGELTTSGFINHYEDLKVKFSFGQGNQARITWIAFLADRHTVSNGIYPVYLFFKKNNLLILAYGVSETQRPAHDWRIPKLTSINEYFKENMFEKPDRYGTSYVFKTYNTLDPIIPDEVNKDLDNLVQIYKKEISTQPKPPKPVPVKFNYKAFKESTDTANLLLDENLILRFISALLTKPFVILTGLSGSGKTKLAQAFSKWVCESVDQICLVPVGADWTNREPLLGFPSALEKGRYILPDNGVLSLILEASKEVNQDKPYFLILDEMNLSHVERYFADFLSAMESGDQIPLHSSIAELMNNGEVPSTISIPKNLFIIGTVNIDETTYMFSPKVLDRASVIEFRVSYGEMNKYLTTAGILDLNSIQGLGSTMSESFLEISQSKELIFTNKELISNSLMKFFSELKRVGAEFGYRSASEIMRFSSIIKLIEPSWEISAIIDASIMQKLLPKVHGSRRKLEPVLKMLALLCLKDEFKNGNGFKIESLLISDEEIAGQENISYPVSFEKIRRMHRRLIDNGFTSYAEA
jgi:5-methylcytosine-specific restriction protein B